MTIYLLIFSLWSDGNLQDVKTGKFTVKKNCVLRCEKLIKYNKTNFEARCGCVELND